MTKGGESLNTNDDLPGSVPGPEPTPSATPPMPETVVPGSAASAAAPVVERTYTLGGRTYTEAQYRNLARENRAAASPLLVTVGAVVLFAALVAGLFGYVLTDFKLTGTGLFVAGIIMALVPALIWLMAFYLQDRLEPEPKSFVIGVFLLGAILAVGVGQPLIRNVFGVQNWTGNNLVVDLLAAILIVGFTQEFLKYAAVRYTVYFTREFDERVDGIIYGAAAGLGYATMLNIQYITTNGGVDMAVGVMRVVTAALAQASFAGITGYFIGIAKFERKGPFWLPLGITIAAILNGVVSFLLGQVTRISGLSFNPWYALVLAVVVAGITFVLLFNLIRRLNAATLAAAQA
jgi:RsiW-degrading membrane proteinase PrsW (M82 family)